MTFQHQVDNKIIEPDFPLELKGYKYIRRGPTPRGWSTNMGRIYRCARCGDRMPANYMKLYQCKCEAMHLDFDYGGFGSSLGDQNILVYRKKILGLF